jgi:diaminopimelate epimerase
MNEVSEETVFEIGRYSKRPHTPQPHQYPDRKGAGQEQYSDRDIRARRGIHAGVGQQQLCRRRAAHKLGLVDGDIQVHMPGGVLRIEIDADWNVRMTGSVNRVGEMTLCDEVLQSPFGG